MRKKATATATVEDFEAFEAGRGRRGLCKVRDHDHHDLIEALLARGKNANAIADYLALKGLETMDSNTIRRHARRMCLCPR